MGYFLSYFYYNMCIELLGLYQIVRNCRFGVLPVSVCFAYVFSQEVLALWLKVYLFQN